jgi:hypothetical protein
MAVAQIQSSMNAGEISPELYGEVNLKNYASAATTLRNMQVNYRGGAMSRGGLAFVGRCKQPVSGTGPPRPVPFQFSITQAYTLDFGDNYLRFVFQGGYVLENPVAITGAAQTDPAQIAVAGTPFDDGDWVFAAGVNGMTQINGNTYIVTDVTPGSFSLLDLNGNFVNATAFGAYISGGTFSRLYTLATPYAAIDLPYLKFSQTADVMSLTCSNPITGTEYLPYELTRFAATDWTLEASDFDPVIAPPTSVAATANSQAPSNGINATFAYVVTATDAKGNESIASAIASCHGADLQVEAGTNLITWPFVQGAQFYNVYRAPTSTDSVSGSTVTPIPVPPGSIFGFIGSSYGTQFADNNTTPDLTQVPPVHQDPFSRGQIVEVEITGAGSGLSAVTYDITTVSGVNFSGTPIVVGGSLGGFPITNNGSLYQPGDSIAFNGAGFASGAIEFGSINPSNGDTVTLNGVLWTFVTAITGNNQTIIGATLAVTLSQFVADLSASTNPGLTVASYAPDITNENLLITYNTAGTVGDAYTLAASRATPSGGTLTGGAGSGTAGVKASGTLLFGSGNPTNGQTIVLDGVTWTFVTSGATGNETNLKGSLALTLIDLASDLNASTNTEIELADYSEDATHLIIRYVTVGVAGNSYALAGGTSGATPSAATLTGGADGSTTPTAELIIGPESGTYPGVVTYFQQRRFYANSFNNPDTFWATQTGLYSNFDTSIPTVSTDAITASPWTEQVNGIQWLIPMPGGLIAMTGLRAWQIIGEGSYQLNVQPVTPSTTQAQPQAFNGCSATIPPVVIDYDVLYVQAVGNTTVFDLSWNFWVNIYTGADLTILSSHLFLYRQITQWAWARQPYKVLWASCNDGTMLSLTYLKEQEVYGWARHDTLGLVVGIATASEPPVNAIYCVVQRFPPYAPAGVYFMERMDDRIWQSVEDTYAVDGAVSNPMLQPNAALYATAGSGNAVPVFASAAIFSAGDVDQILRMAGGIALIASYLSATEITVNWYLGASNGPTGLPYAPSGAWTIAAPVVTLNAPHLAGMTLVGLADGVPISGLLVAANGTVTLPFAASNVKVGLPFLPQFQSPYANGAQIVQGARKMIPAVTIRLAASGSFQIGTNQPDGAAQDPPQLGPIWTGMNAANVMNSTGGQQPPITYLSPAGQKVTQLWTGDLRVDGTAVSGWQSKGQVAVQQTLPLPLEVVACMPELLPGDLPEVTYQQGAQQSGGQNAPRPPGPWMIGKGGEARI